MNLKRQFDVAVIGCSAGGLTSLQTLFGHIGKPLGASVVIVCHSGSEVMDTFCELLQRHSPMPVQEAEERTRPMAGRVYVAPAGYHLLFERDGAFALNVDERVEYSRPSIDVLFESAAEVWADRLIGMVLTGANADGARGLRSIRQRGGLALVEDPDTASVSTMPTAALDMAGADYCLPLNGLGPLLESLCHQ